MVDPHSPLDFDTPHSDPPDVSWYHPLSLLWLAIEIPYVLCRWFWQKRQSWRANRTNITFDAVMALQRLEFIADDEDVPRQRRKNAREAEELVVRICEELNIDDSRIDRHADKDGDRDG